MHHSIKKKKKIKEKDIQNAMKSFYDTTDWITNWEFNKQLQVEPAVLLQSFVYPAAQQHFVSFSSLGEFPANKEDKERIETPFQRF